MKIRFGPPETKFYQISKKERQQKLNHINYIDKNIDKWYFQYWNELSVAERVKLRSRRYRREQHLMDRIGTYCR